jgi:hypothetical protein
VKGCDGGYYIVYSRGIWVRHVIWMVDKRNTYRILVGKSVGKRPFRRRWRRWNDKLKQGDKPRRWKQNTSPKLSIDMP